MTEQTITESVEVGYELQRIGDILEKMGYPVHFAERSPDVPFDQILLALDEGENEAVNHVMRIYFQEDIIHNQPEWQAKLASADVDDTATLQFFAEWQLAIPTSKLLDTYRLLNVFGRMMPIGNFGMVEDDDLCGIYFRYTLMQRRDQYDILNILELVDVMQFYLNRLMPQLVHWFFKEMTLDAIIEQTERGLIEMGQALAHAKDS